MPDRVLIANRGEIAVRIAHTLRRLGIESVAVHGPEDATAPHVLACDHVVALRSDGLRSPYLDIEQLVEVARAGGCDAVHPGYGFLAERAEAARAFTAAGVTWIGPSAEAIDLLGDKIASKRTAEDADVPVVPGMTVPPGHDLDAADVTAFAEQAGLPLLLKATAGGGGKGMRRIDAVEAIPGAVEAAGREALAAFGRGELLVERLVDPARHVEVQVAVDAHGGAWAIGERECSLQRRHQKLIEESPAACLTVAERTALHEAAVRLAVAAGYRNLGTVEFLLDARPTVEADPTAAGDSAPAAPRPFFFLEMNARLQVEHPVTELVHGLDLVELQLRIADGEALDLDAAARTTVGHAIEARICAERVAVRTTGAQSGTASVTADFLPVVGSIVAYAEPTGPGVRIDSGIATGVEVTTSFDPMLLKVIAHGRDRAQALDRLDRALGELTILGLETNAGFLRRLLARPEVVADAGTTTLVETLLADPAVAGDLGAAPSEARARALAAAAAVRHRELDGASDGTAFGLRDGWRLLDPGSTRLRLQDADDRVTAVDARVTDDGLDLRLDDGDAAIAVDATVVAAGWRHARDGEWLWLHGPDGTWAWRDAPETAAGAVAAGGSLAAPLPGVVLELRKQVGDSVAAGETVVVVESMKMELAVDAPHAGVVTAIHVAAGDTVGRGEVLAAVEQEDEA